MPGRIDSMMGRGAMVFNMLRFSRIAAPIAILFLCTVHAVFCQDTEALQLQTREPFTLNLPKIAVSVDDVTNDFDGVRISFAGSEDQVFIGTYNDQYTKNTSRGAEKTLYRENPEKSGFISKFEAKYISKVNKEFVLALEQFDVLLQKGSWGRCLYFDCYFPRFLNGYFYLVCAARSSESALPRGARVPEECFDVSLNSAKTDARINMWRASPDYVIKLRIATKELAQQLQIWQRNIDRAKENDDVATPKELEEALIILDRVYFNLKPPSPVVLKRPRY
jgi:hypothetical protein